MSCRCAPGGVRGRRGRHGVLHHHPRPALERGRQRVDPRDRASCGGPPGSPSSRRGRFARAPRPCARAGPTARPGRASPASRTGSRCPRSACASPATSGSSAFSTANPLRGTASTTTCFTAASCSIVSISLRPEMVARDVQHDADVVAFVAQALAEDAAPRDLEDRHVDARVLQHHLRGLRARRVDALHQALVDVDPVGRRRRRPAAPSRGRCARSSASSSSCRWSRSPRRSGSARASPAGTAGRRRASPRTAARPPSDACACGTRARRSPRRSRRPSRGRVARCRAPGSRSRRRPVRRRARPPRRSRRCPRGRPTCDRSRSHRSTCCRWPRASPSRPSEEHRRSHSPAS